VRVSRLLRQANARLRRNRRGEGLKARGPGTDDWKDRPWGPHRMCGEAHRERSRRAATDTGF